jgi:hypothetical protein
MSQNVTKSVKSLQSQQLLLPISSMCDQPVMQINPVVVSKNNVLYISSGKEAFGLARLVVRTTRCGRVNLGSIPRLDNLPFCPFSDFEPKFGGRNPAGNVTIKIIIIINYIDDSRAGSLCNRNDLFNFFAIASHK